MGEISSNLIGAHIAAWYFDFFEKIDTKSRHPGKFWLWRFPKDIFYQGYVLDIAALNNITNNCTGEANKDMMLVAVEKVSNRIQILCEYIVGEYIEPHL